MKNEFLIKDNYAIMIINSKHGLFKVMIDNDDVEKAKKHTWSIEGYPKNIYVSHRGRKITNLKLHRYLNNCPNNLTVDHINGNRLDNRKENLRNCTLAENLRNKPVINKLNNSSGIKNITWDKSRNKWKVSIEFNSRRVNIGRFACLEEAKTQAHLARQKYHNEFYTRMEN